MPKTPIRFVNRNLMARKYSQITTEPRFNGFLDLQTTAFLMTIATLLADGTWGGLIAQAGSSGLRERSDHLIVYLPVATALCG